MLTKLLLQQTTTHNKCVNKPETFSSRKASITIGTAIYSLLMALLLSTLPAQAQDCTTPSFAPAVVYPIVAEDAFIGAVAVGDFNGDGKNDLAVAGHEYVGVLLNNGDGTFAPPMNLPKDEVLSDIEVGDFNGDGKDDLVVTISDFMAVLVYLNNGDGTFAPPVQYFSGISKAWSVAVGDFNGDGKADLAVANYEAGWEKGVTVLLNNGDGTFAPAVPYAEEGSPLSIAVGDFNGDGKPDLAVTNSDDNTVGVLLNNGDGTFAPMVQYPSPTGSVAVGDFNGDGKADLAVTSAGDNIVGVLLNNGDGTFAPVMLYPSGGFSPRSVAVGDFNGDGKTDLVAVANVHSGNIGVLLNNGDGTFAPGVPFPSGGSFPRSVAVGDFNDDGKADLAVANGGDVNVGVLLNTCTTSCPEINVTIPDAMALPSGVQPNTVYQGYAPASSITLTADVSGGTGPYNFTWSTGSNDPSITVNPTVTTTYTVSVTDASGCPSNLASVTIEVIDVQSGNTGNRVDICHNPGKRARTLSIGAEGVAAHLSHGDMLGSCSSTSGVATQRKPIEEKSLAQSFNVKALPNPSTSYFTLSLQGAGTETIQLRVTDMQGRLIERKQNLQPNQTIKIGEAYRPGTYIVEVVQGLTRKHLKLIKTQ